MAAIFGKRKIFWKLPRVHFLDTIWVENFNEITLFCTVKEIEANLCFSILGKNSKIQNGRHMWGGENFLKIAKTTFLRYSRWYNSSWLKAFGNCQLPCASYESFKMFKISGSEVCTMGIRRQTQACGRWISYYSNWRCSPRCISGCDSVVFPCNMATKGEWR